MQDKERVYLSCIVVGDRRRDYIDFVQIYNCIRKGMILYSNLTHSSLE